MHAAVSLKSSDAHVSSSSYVMQDAHVSSSSYAMSLKSSDAHVSSSSYAMQDAHVSSSSYAMQDAHVSSSSYAMSLKSSLFRTCVVDDSETVCGFRRLPAGRAFVLGTEPLKEALAAEHVLVLADSVRIEDELLTDGAPV